jgi:LysR family glycine cleavage system transcriptional activator
MKDLPHTTWLRAFEAAARHGSFSAAAQELNLTPAAISQQIRLLEQHLETTLFVRLARGVTLTDRGQAYAQPIRKSFSDIDRATRGLFDKAGKRTLKVRASISCAALVIAPRLMEFQEQHPDIDVQLTTFVWADRFVDAQSDIDIRFGHGDWADGDATLLGNEYAIPVCHPNYANIFGEDLNIQSLSQMQIIKIIGSETDWTRLAEQYNLDLGISAQVMHVDSSLIALQAVMTGQGIAMVLESFANLYLNQGMLIAPFDYRLPIKPSHYLVQRDGTGTREEVQAFSKWISSLY